MNFVKAAAHEPFDRVDHTLRRLDEGAARGVAHSNCRTSAIGRNGIERDHGRHKIQAVRAGNDHRRIALHISDQGVGGSEVDSDYAFIRHACLLCSL